MAELHSFPPDKRPSALYLVAHMGPLRNPHPIELQHMRIIRYIHLLREHKHEEHHYSEDEDVFIELNLYPPKPYPALMRLGEAIATHKYRAVFVDLARSTDFAGLSVREKSLLTIWNILEALPVCVIDVSSDPDDLLSNRLVECFGEDGRHAAYRLNSGHDYVGFFPAAAAMIARAVFERELKEEYPLRDEKLIAKIRDTMSWLECENPYARAKHPLISRPLELLLDEKKREHIEEQRNTRRKSGETLYRCSPDGDPKLLEEGIFNNRVRSPQSLLHAEKRLAEFGFQKLREGQTVSFRRTVGNFILFADPREEGKITISTYKAEPLRGKQKKQKYRNIWVSFSIPDRWWGKNTSARFEAYLEKTVSGRLGLGQELQPITRRKPQSASD